MTIGNAKLILPDRIINGSLRVENGRIAEISAGNPDSYDLDAGGMYVAPGFVDIHTHGGGGIDFLDDEPWEPALGFHLESGTTALLPTALTSPPERIRSFCARIRTEMKSKRSSAKILGAHIEGPYLSLKNKGAQPASCILVPSRDSYDFLTDNADVIKTVTISPELDGAPQMIRDLRAVGIKLCGGHDDGKKSTLLPAIEAGLSHLTHMWCAMSTVAMYDGTREPGLVELGLTSDSLTAEIIADGHHMPEELVKIVYRCKGARRLCVVSDCLRAGGMPADGRLWSLGRREDRLTEFIVSDGVARLPDNTRLAGSILPVGKMLPGLVECGIPLHEAVRMASLTPAEIIGADSELGSLEVGKCADFVILDDSLQVKSVFTDGIKLI